MADIKTDVTFETGQLRKRLYLYEGDHIVATYTVVATGKVIASSRTGFRATRRHLIDRNKYSPFYNSGVQTI